MTFEIAKRKAFGFLAGLSGVPGSGKTYTALLIAAGLAGDLLKKIWTEDFAKEMKANAKDVDALAAQQSQTEEENSEPKKLFNE